MVQAEAKRKRLAPYVPASTLSAFFDHIRYVKTPEKVDSNLVQDYGIAEGHAFALISALKFLGLTEDDGTVTPAFRSLQTGGDEFQSSLRDILQRAYEDVFSRLDVSRDSRDKIKNFFARNYSPATAAKATRLFLDLCGEAGIETAAATQPRKAPQPRRKTAIEKGHQPPSMQRHDVVVDENAEIGEDVQRGRVVLEVRLTEDDLSIMAPDDIEAVFTAAGKIEVARRKAHARQTDATPEHKHEDG